MINELSFFGAIFYPQRPSNDLDFLSKGSSNAFDTHEKDMAISATLVIVEMLNITKRDE